MTSNMMKAKVKQGVHFVREWIQQDSTRFGADSANEFCSTIEQGKRTVKLTTNGVWGELAKQNRHRYKGIVGGIPWTSVAGPETSAWAICENVSADQSSVTSVQFSASL